MFDPLSLSHDEVVEKLIEERSLADKTAITEAFLASLSTRRLEWRSALGSCGFARHFPAHLMYKSPHDIFQTGAVRCRLCGLYDLSKSNLDLNVFDMNVLSFEKHKWGGVRRSRPNYAWFDLYTTRLAETAQATGNDKAIFQNILAVARTMPAKASVSDLAKSLKGALPSSEPERRILIEILSACGILQPIDRPGFFSEFTADTDRTRPHHSKNDWDYPAIWWTGKDGVNETALAYWFPDL